VSARPSAVIAVIPLAPSVSANPDISNRFRFIKCLNIGRLMNIR